MIYKCENCINRESCPEKQEGYKKLCEAVEAIDKQMYFGAYYSLSLKCDYYFPDETTFEQDGGAICRE